MLTFSEPPCTQNRHGCSIVEAEAMSLYPMESRRVLSESADGKRLESGAVMNRFGFLYK